MTTLLLLAAAAQADWVLTVDGLGPVKIGMTRAQVARELHAQLRGEAIESVDQCVEQGTRGLPGVTFMFEDKKLGRISIHKPSRITTPRGIGVGATAAQIKRAYGPRLKAEWHHYVGAPAQYLTYWTKPQTRGVRFETGTDRRAEIIHAGGPSINYIEGCA
ncbi:MAG: hypothetical protein ABIS38_09065 [Sphingomicrobium sp.]